MANNESYLSYSQAFHHLQKRIDAKPYEMAGWVFMGQKFGGLNAYTDVNELEDPPRYHYSLLEGELDYMSPLARCWFNKDDVLEFSPSAHERFVCGRELLQRWENVTPGISALAIISSQTEESRLLGFHPILGDLEIELENPNGTVRLEDSLFLLAQILEIEKEQFRHGKAPPAAAPTQESCLPNVPARKDEWFNAISDTVQQLSRELGRCPTSTETWTALRNAPPKAYGITSGDHLREFAVWMNEKPLSLSAFRYRWKRYTCNSE